MVTFQELVLVPGPRNVQSVSADALRVAPLPIVVQGPLEAVVPIGQRLQRSAREILNEHWPVRAGSLVADEPAVLLRLDPSTTMPREGYHLTVTSKGAELVAADPAGLFYATMTFRQILRQCRAAIPAVRIEDYPDFPSRGVMLDVSRDKVPTLETLLALVDQLAEWKVNHLELYTEHVFAYRDHRDVWCQASPFTHEDILRLDQFCRDRFIELVPNQNSFGHMHRWLELPRYRHLAACPDGFDWPWGGRSDGPFSLDPTNPACLHFLDGLYTELLPQFTSRKFNVGCDETFDLGQGKSEGPCETRGKGRVYVDFILQIRELVRRHGHTMHFWGDVILRHPELVPTLPKDVVVLEWGYEANHPFDDHGRKFAESGIPFYVCPGTSSWISLGGRTENCLGNLRSAAANGLKHGAVGYLNTDWGDLGHWQYLPISYLGFVAGAALSWCHAANADDDFIAALDVHVFRDDARVMGRVAHDLGNAYLRTGQLLSNCSIFFRLFQQTPPVLKLADTLTVDSLGETQDHIHAAMAPLASARMGRPDATLIMDEFANTARMMLHACYRGLAILEDRLSSPGTGEQLGPDLRYIVGEHRRLWMRRNRPGGLDDSCRLFEQRLREYDHALSAAEGSGLGAT